MTANELFLRHVSENLRQYNGNLRWFCEAVDNGHVPPADHEGVRPFVQLLKRHMGIATATDEDEFLLRFGLIVPGLMRGIHPPVSVLNPERGGFSDQRLEQAAAQVRRLHEALRLGRRYFAGLSSSPVIALRELAASLRDTISSEEWVAMHASLPEAETNTLAQRAFASLDDPSEPKDLCEIILACLANFRPGGLGAQIGEAFKRGILRPPSIYRNAPNEVANGLINLIESATNQQLLRLNHLLLALAWTRGEPAHLAFLEWRKTLPRWAARLHVPPEDYLHSAGWALDDKGRHKELISLSCYRIAQCTDPSKARFPVPCRARIEDRCPACGDSLAWLFDFSILPNEFFSEDRTNAPRRILCCLHCASFCPAVFSRYQLDGTAEWASRH